MMIEWHRIGRAAALLLAVLMTACASDAPQRRSPGPAPVEDRSVDRDNQRDREVDPQPPPRERESKPAVLALIDRADDLHREGKQREAAAQLDRALRLDPRDARLLQRRAELFLEMDQAAQAEAYALKSFQLSVKHGALCRRNWETASRARRTQGDRSGSTEALQRKEDC